MASMNTCEKVEWAILLACGIGATIAGHFLDGMILNGIAFLIPTITSLRPTESVPSVRSDKE